MANVTLKRQANVAPFGGAPYGNLSELPFKLATVSGIATGGDQATAIASGDVVRLGVIPAGMLLVDALIVISAAFTAASTAKLGFLYVDGVDDTNVPQDDAYFVPAGQALSSAAILRRTATSAPKRITKDAYLVLTNAGATQAATSQLDVFVIGEVSGK